MLLEHRHRSIVRQSYFFVRYLKELFETIDAPKLFLILLDIELYKYLTQFLTSALWLIYVVSNSLTYIGLL